MMYVICIYLPTWSDSTVLPTLKQTNILGTYLLLDKHQTKSIPHDSTRMGTKNAIPDFTCPILRSWRGLGGREEETHNI